MRVILDVTTRVVIDTGDSGKEDWEYWAENWLDIDATATDDVTKRKVVECGEIMGVKVVEEGD